MEIYKHKLNGKRYYYLGFDQNYRKVKLQTLDKISYYYIDRATFKKWYEKTNN